MKTTKLSLSKETLVQLSEQDMPSLDGGVSIIIRPSVLCSRMIVSCVYVCRTQIPQLCY